MEATKTDSSRSISDNDYDLALGTDDGELAEFYKELSKRDALKLGADWIEATNGRPITGSEYRVLFERGFTSCFPDDIPEIFGSWEEFQASSLEYYAQISAEREEKATELFDRLNQEIKAGFVPAEILYEAEANHIRFCEIDGEPRGKVKKLSRYSLTSRPAAREEVIRRYSKFLVTEQLLKNRPSDQEASTDRKLSIAVGFNITTGKALSSFKGSLRNSTITDFSDIDIEIAAEELGVFDYIYPEFRDEHLKAIESTAESPAAEYYYDTELKKVIVLGRIALEEFSQDEGRNHLDRLRRSGRLLIGRSALRAYEGGAVRESIYRLGWLLRNGLPEGFPKNHMRTMDLTRDDFIEIGKWISSVADPPVDARERHLNESIFMVAKQLGIGFSIHRGSRFLNEFSSMTNFYNVLGEARTHRKNVIAQNESMMVEAVAELGKKLGRRPTYTEMIEAHLENPAIPNPSTINRLSKSGEKAAMAQLFEAAGLPETRLHWEASDCLAWGLGFIEQTGREPREYDVDRESKLGNCPSRRAFRKNFDNSFSEFKRQLRELHQKSQTEPEELAA
ncbi:MAG TPA: hypothetical protein VHD84_01370 [Candidatus Saccharimonadales bacterium]|nr:hypothetical protein [Candidatus Saccharimonadales bacterium]